MKRFWVTLLGVVIMLSYLATGVGATSFTTIVMDGANDFEADEDVPGTSGSIWYFTWDAGNFYFGANNPDIDDNNPTKWVHLYMDTDPHGSAGTSTGINYNTQQPGLPFNADYHFRWKNDDSYINLQSWNGSSWVDGAQAGINRSRSGQYVEFVIPRANLGSPEAVKVVAGMINEAPFVESTFFMTPSSNTPGYDANYTSYFGFPLIEGVSPDAACNVDTYPAGSKATGAYNTASTWTGSTVPPSGSSTSVTVASGHTVTLDVDTTLRCLTVLAGGGFDGGANNNTVQIANAGRVQLNGAYTRNTETLSFAGAGTLAGTATLNHVALSGAVSFSTGLTVDGILTINANGAVGGNAPTYGASSTLRYNSGGPYTANNEWLAGTSGPGVPQNIQVSASGTNVTLAGAAVRTARGSVTIDAGATLTLGGSAGNGLDVRGNWTNNGSFSSAVGRTVTFTGSSGTQTISGSTTFYNLALNNSGATTNFGASTVTVDNTFTATAGTMNGGASTFVFTGGVGSIQGASAKNFHNLTINSGASVSHPSGGNITISGDFTNDGVYSQNSGRTTTFSKTGSAALTGSGATTFGSVVVQGGTALNAGTHSFMVTGGTWQVSSGGQFDGGTATVTFSGATGAIAIQGAGTHQFNHLLIATGKTLANNSQNQPLNVKGNWTNNGSYTPGTEAVTFNGSAGQTIGGTNATSFYGLTIANSGAGISLSQDQLVLQLLTLSNGDVNLGGYTLTLTNATPGRGVTVVGNRTISGPGTVTFVSGNRTISGGTLTFGVGVLVNVNVSTDFGANVSTINGTLRINSGGAVANNGPTYGVGALLQYNTSIGRGPEWSATSGPGYPYHVQISNNSTFNLGAGGTGMARQMAGDLTVDSGSTLTMNAGGFQMTAALTVLGDVTIDGALTLSSLPGGDLAVGGDWSNGGTFTPNGRTVTFDGSSAQTIGGAASTTFFNLVLNNVAGASLANDQTVDGTLTLTNGRLTLGGNILTLGPSAPAVAGALNAFNMVVADGAGALCRRFGTISSYTYPIGDATGTAEYSPVTGVTVSGTGSGTPSVCFRVVDDVHPDLPTNLSTYITRYWNGAVIGGTISSLSYDATFSFVAADQVGAEGMNGKKWNGGFPWDELGVVSGTSFTGSGLGSFSDFTAFKSGVLAVTLAEFYAEQVEDFVRVTWETVSELNNAGFNLYRSNSPAGALTLLANLPSQAPGSVQGFTYTYEDLAVQPGTTYWYWLEDISLNGATTLHGPVSVTVLVPTAVTLGALRALPAANAVPLAVVALAIVALATGGAALQRRRSHQESIR